MTPRTPTLLVITGPTGVGKTAVAIEVARQIGCDIVNADSRQVYRDLPIGTAAPTAAERALVPHHLVGFLPLEAQYSAAQYEADVLALLPQLWQRAPVAVLCGGSMLYVDAVCRGIDELPTISTEVREAVRDKLAREGLDALVDELRALDPDYCATLDLHNTRRVAHAVEICRQAGVPYSSLRTGQAKQRPFNIVKVGLNMEREELFDRINRRVDAMIAAGLEQEAQRVYALRHLNALNTVGYKELFAMMDGTMSRQVAIERIKKNTRVYAKKQLTWYRRDPLIEWQHPSGAAQAIIRRLQQVL